MQNFARPTNICDTNNKQKKNEPKKSKNWLRCVIVPIHLMFILFFLDRLNWIRLFLVYARSIADSNNNNDVDSDDDNNSADLCVQECVWYFD